MTAKTRRLRELIASGEFLYMPSAATPLECRIAEAACTPLVYTGSYTGFDDAEFTAVRQDIEDLIGLDAYYRIEPESKPG